MEPSTPSPPPAPSASPPYSKWTVDAGTDTTSPPTFAATLADPRAVVTAHALPAPAIPPASPLPFLHTIERLKTTPREGWRRFAIPNGESIADHMHRMALMTFLAPAQLRARGLDVDRAARMALVHDMAESLVGDITPVDGIAKADKAQREAGAMDWLCGRLLGADRAADADAPPDGDRTGARAGMAAGGAEMRELWCEYEAGTTLTARFVHDVDKVELVLQMVEYERRGKGMLDLGEFAHVIERIDLPAMREWAADAMRERAELWKQFGKDPSEADIGRKLAERALPGNAGTEE